MTRDLQKKIKGHWQTFTTSEQRIASYLLQNLSGIPFETAASLGQRIGVSAMTVGRFLRKLGYDGVNEIKEELRGDTTWLKLYRNPAPAGDADATTSNLAAEIRALSEIHALTRSKEWAPIVHLLVSADQVKVASFQLGRFLGQTFATLLGHIRPHVRFASGVDGAYTDLLIDSTANSCVVLIDERRYSAHFRVLAEEVAARGIPLVILTDTQCYWSHRLTPNVLMIPVNTDRKWHSYAAFSTLFSLLLTAATAELGDTVYERISQITALRQQFIGFNGPSLSSEPPAAGAAEAKATTRRRKHPRKA